MTTYKRTTYAPVQRRLVPIIACLRWVIDKSEKATVCRRLFRC